MIAGKRKLSFFFLSFPSLTGSNQWVCAIGPLRQNSLQIRGQLISNVGMCSHTWMSVTPAIYGKVDAIQLD